jgi:Tol biopolymer transport system component
MIRGRTNLARVTAEGHIEPITTGTGSEWEAASAPDGSLAYISSRSGSYQVWLLRPGSSESERVTSILSSYMTSPAWSPDGRTIAFVAVTGRRAEIYTTAPDGSRLRQITHDGFGKRDPIYSISGDRIFYLLRVGGTWHLMQLTLTPNAKPRVVRGGEGWRVLRTNVAGQLYGQRGNSIVTLDSSAPRAEVRLSNVDVWAVAPQGIYVRRGRAPARPSSIDFYPWNGPPRKVADTPRASANISVDRDGAVLFSQSPVYEIDLGLLELRH